MPRMIQVRHVPDALHRRLKARAAMAGMSLSEYLLGELRRLAQHPTLAEMEERLSRRTPVHVSEPPADAVRAERTRR